MNNTFEVVGNLDLRRLANDDLDTLIAELNKERERREAVQQTNDWQDLIAHIRKYIRNYGAITYVDNDVYTIIDEETFFNQVGMIDNQKY